jgi:hypothetical protein
MVQGTAGHGVHMAIHVLVLDLARSLALEVFFDGHMGLPRLWLCYHNA